MKEVKVYNNLTRQKDLLKTIEKGVVRFYSCGPTTYDFVHVGNAMAFVTGDLMYRSLKALGYKVLFVRNFTDVDDKIINKAKERGIDPLVHSKEFVVECTKDMNALNMLAPTHTPKVSETIPEIIELVQTLVNKGHAYVADGDVLFHVPSFKDYGKLSKKDLESLEHGIRVEVSGNKKHPSDFVLWKASKAGEPSWDSPWGKGRPGWHIECSAMAKKFLGESIDMHHGGVDLIFPHHENEIAQSEAASGKPFVNCWCHNEFVNFGKDKMSKSLGNVVTIRGFVEKFGGEILRQILLSSHYRSKIEWGDEAIERAINDSERIHRFLKLYKDAQIKNFDKSSDTLVLSEIKDCLENIENELCNDFNIVGALACFFSLIRTMNREYLDEFGNYQDKKKLDVNIVNYVDKVILFMKEATGLIYDDVEAVLEKLNNAKKTLNSQKLGESIDPSEIDSLVKERVEARKSKNFKRADEIRNILNEKGVAIKDNPDGTVTWSYK